MLLSSIFADVRSLRYTVYKCSKLVQNIRVVSSGKCKKSQHFNAMSGRVNKRTKFHGQQAAKPRRKILRNNGQGITKRFLRRLARGGG